MITGRLSPPPGRVQHPFRASSKISRTVLFWAAFTLTRPLRATLGDTLTKPHADGGLNLSRFVSTAVIAVFMIACLLLFPQCTGEHPGAEKS